MIKLKAASLKSTIEFAKEKFGKEAFQQAVESLSEEDKTIINNSFLTVSRWTPLDTFLNLCEVIVRQLNNGDYSIITPMAEYGAEKELKGIYSVFIRMTSPEIIIKKSARLFKTYINASECESSAEIIAPGKVIITVTGFQKQHLLFETHVLAWVKKALELSGAKNLHLVITASLATGKGYFVLTGTWDKKER